MSSKSECVHETCCGRIVKSVVGGSEGDPPRQICHWLMDRGGGGGGSNDNKN